jgi:hypothetical protein
MNAIQHPRNPTTSVLLALPLALLLQGCGDCRPQASACAAVEPAAPSASPSEQPDVWIAVTRKVEKGNNYMYGRTSAAALHRLTLSPQLPAMLCLHDCHWYGDHGVVLLESEGNSGIFYLRIDNLVSIEVQKPKDLEKLRADEREAMRKAEEAERAEGEKKKAVIP